MKSLIGRLKASQNLLVSIISLFRADDYLLNYSWSWSSDVDPFQTFRNAASIQNQIRGQSNVL